MEEGDDGMIHQPRLKSRAQRSYRSLSARRRNCYDNAVTESFFSSLKNEVVSHYSFKTRDDVRTTVFECIEVFYNRRRSHQSLDYVSPPVYEREAGVA